jgi:hypothetical protein
MEQVEEFARDCMGTLPDSLSRRQVHLMCLSLILPPKSEVRGKAIEMLVHLNSAQSIQREFVFKPNHGGNHS